MYTSDNEKWLRASRASVVYLLVSLFCALVGAIYELFSHEVYSFFMLYAFAFPLAGGALPFLLLAISRRGKLPSPFARQLYGGGIAAFTVGSFVQGALEIYGTENDLVRIYWYAGTILCLTAIIIAAAKRG